MDSDKIKIHRIVYGNHTDEISVLLKTWDLAKKDYKIIDWSLDETNEFILDNFPEYMDVSDNFRNMAELSDFHRFLLLYKYGGIYLDWDIELRSLMGFNTLIETHPAGYLLKDDSMNSICVEHFYLPANSPLLIDVVDDIAMISRAGYRTDAPHYTGTYRLKRVFGTKDYGIPVLGIHQAFTHNYVECNTGLSGNNTAPMTHHWMHTWIK